MKLLGVSLILLLALSCYGMRRDLSYVAITVGSCASCVQSTTSHACEYRQTATANPSYACCSSSDTSARCQSASDSVLCDNEDSVKDSNLKYSGCPSHASCAGASSSVHTITSSDQWTSFNHTGNTPLNNYCNVLFYSKHDDEKKDFKYVVLFKFTAIQNMNIILKGINEEKPLEINKEYGVVVGRADKLDERVVRLLAVPTSSGGAYYDVQVKRGSFFIPTNKTVLIVLLCVGLCALVYILCCCCGCVIQCLRSKK